jgi:outer membrane murein-binding lipoprotein Lpp
VKQRNAFLNRVGEFNRIGVLVLAGSVSAWSQTLVASPPPANDGVSTAVHDLQQQVNELRAAVAEIRSEAAQYRAETAALRRELQAMRTPPAPAQMTPAASSYASAAPTVSTPPEISPRPAVPSDPLPDRVAALEETTQLLNNKLDDQYQTKVESASKYRVRLSGIVLLNLFSNRGQTDNTDFPVYATGPNQGGNFGATLRQSEIGLEAFGPTFAGAKISANLQADFAGGFPNTWNGVDSGVFRLRIARMRMDWEKTSIVIGQDDLFVSPLSPTSFASLAVPALTYAGNLWAWTPQVRVEHRFDLSNDNRITVQGGILDNLTGEFPSDPYFRSAGPGEQTSQPAFGFRTAWTNNFLGRPITIGAAGYYSRQNWPVNQHNDGWAGMTDWEIPIVPRLVWSGEFYRGRAVGGIGGGISQSVVFDGIPGKPSTPVNGLDSIGGWSQLKFKFNSRLEFNAAFGLDNPTSAEVRAALPSQIYVGQLLTQNRGGLVNFIFRPRSNLLFSTEYRYLQSFPLPSSYNTADQFNVMMGVLF